MLRDVFMLFRCNNSFIALPPPPDKTLSSIEINFLLLLVFMGE